MSNAKIRKWPYLGFESIKCKNKVTLFSETFKVEEKKVFIFFSFLAHGSRYSYFFSFYKLGSLLKKSRKCVYLGPGAKNQKNKSTFFSQTFKVEEKKVSLFFSF